MRFSWVICYLTASVLAHILLSSGVHGKKQVVCETPYCKNLAATFVRNRNTAVDPCENFHEYACGSWMKHNPMPDYERIWSQFQIMQLNVNKRLRVLLLEEIKDADIPPVKAVKRLYRSCLDTAKIRKKGIRPFLKILKGLGGWPMAMPVNAWKEDENEWQSIDAYYYQILGHSTFYDLKPIPNDVKNSTENMLQISPNPDLPLCDIDHLDTLNTTRSAYVKGIIRVALHFANKSGFNLNTADLATDIVDMLLFEIKLIKVISSYINEDELFEDEEKITLPKFQEWYANSTAPLQPDGKINFLYLNETLLHAANVSLREDENITVITKEYFVKLTELFQSTPKRVIVNYIHWNVIYALLPYLTPTMSKIKDNILYEEYDVTAHPPRWLSCIVHMGMNDVASYMFLKRYVTLNVTAKATRLTQAIQVELENLAGNATGLPGKVKYFLKNKLHKIIRGVGSPDWYRNNTIVTEEYDGLTMTDDFFQNAIRLQNFVSLKHLKEIRKPSKVERWFMEPTVINAYYLSLNNKIHITAGDFQEPFLTESLPEAVNYGFIGIIIGHELAHSIDNDSIAYDSNGKGYNWTNSELKEYREKAKCFVNQYNGFITDEKDDDGNDLRKLNINPSIPSVSTSANDDISSSGTKRVKELNGTLTLEENMADTTGLEASYHAFKALQKKMPYEVKLPGLESLSDDELFFLSFANFGCFQSRSKFYKFLIKSEVHSPFEYRVIGTISNSPEFAKAYNCPVGSPMNPKKKCNIFH